MYLTHRVRTVTATQTVPQRGEVCSLKKIWKNPRVVKETTPGLYFGYNILSKVFLLFDTLHKRAEMGKQC